MGAPKKRFGQHFLRDRTIIASIVQHIAPQPNERILEIGPGGGVLTFALLSAGAAITAVEIDRDLAATLQQSPAAQTGALAVICGDILRQDLPQLAGDLRVVGNLPYNISTPLLLQLAQTATPEMWLMVQKEVGERAAASAGSRQYGRLSVSLQFSHQVEMVLQVPPRAFSPPPQVESVLLCIRRRPVSPPPPHFAAVVAAAFQSRRKMLGNGLAAFAVDWHSIGIAPQRRPQTLSPQEFAAVANAVIRPPAA